MTSPIRTERHDDVLVIISDNPPVNALGHQVRQGLKDGIEVNQQPGTSLNAAFGKTAGGCE
jgi:hypothetical protein